MSRKRTKPQLVILPQATPILQEIYSSNTTDMEPPTQTTPYNSIIDSGVTFSITDSSTYTRTLNALSFLCSDEWNSEASGWTREKLELILKFFEAKESELRKLLNEY